MRSIPDLSQAAEPHPDHEPTPKRQRRLHPASLYSLLVVLLPMLAVPLCICLGMSNFFLQHGASVWVRSNDSIYNLHNRECDVLIYGDSTAMTGINPDLLNHYTGFRTCNIAVTNAVLAVTGNLTLDRYLQQNARPRMLIIQLSPDDFQRGNRVWDHTVYAEGLLEQLRHGSPVESRHILLTHPHEAIAFAGYAAGYAAYYALKDAWFRSTHRRLNEDTIEVRNGFFTPPSPARTRCEGADSLPADSTASFARSLAAEYQRTYSGQGSVVLVDVAPIPSCDDHLAAYTRELDGVTSNHLEALPIGLFNDGRHYTAFGSRVVSALVARQVNQTAMENPALDDRVPSTHEAATLHTVGAADVVVRR